VAPSDTEVVHGEAVDPAHLERAGWSNAELIWEQIQEAAAECDVAGAADEAAELWRGALEVAREHLTPQDPRLATSLTNHAVALRRAGHTDAAQALFREALAVWDAAADWIAALRPERTARSSTFHFRLEGKYPGAYERAARARHAALAAEGRAAALACSRGENRGGEGLRRWQREGRRAGFTGTRKLMAAALLVAPGAEGD